MKLRRHLIAIVGALLIMPVSTVPAAAAEPPAPAQTGDMTLHVMPQSHIDLAWWWRYDPETLQVVVKHTLETAFDNMEKYPDYTFTYLQVPAIEPLETLYPDLFYKLRYYAHRGDALDGRIPNPSARGDEGRLAIGSGFYCEVDGSVPCGESLVRQCLYGKRYFLKHFGMDIKTAWFQDAWTHPWTLPQILKKSGMDAYVFSRPRGEGEPMFWWEGPDGSRVLACKPFMADGESMPPVPEIEQYLSDMRQKYGVKNGFTLIGVGNHGGGALRADVDRMKQLMAERTGAGKGGAKPPKIQFSTPTQFLDALLKDQPNLPTVSHEPEQTLRGAYTTVGEIKKGNRYSENLLLTLEKFSVIAHRLQLADYPAALLNDSWKKVMLNQFHDTISGTDVIPSIEDALRRYREVRESGQAALQARLSAISTRVDTRGEGAPVVVFNPLAWERNGVVEVEIPSDAQTAFFTVSDGNEAVAAQLVRREQSEGNHFAVIAIIARHVPSLGYKTYFVKPCRPSEKGGEKPKADACVLENDLYRITVDAASGDLSGIYDKFNRREVLAAKGGGNQIQIIEDLGDSEGFLKDAAGKIEHNIWDGQRWETDANPQIALVEDGPVRKTLEVKKKFGLARFTQRITLAAGSPQIDFSLAIDWEGKNKMVKVAFPLSISPPNATFEIPYGAIKRESTGEEVCAQNWVDVSEDSHGVSLLNDSRYGHDIQGNVLRLSVLRSPEGPVATTDEAGTHTVQYSLYPHQGGWQAAQVVQRGQELNNSLIGVACAAHPGDLPPAFSFVQVEPANMVMTVLKKAEDSEDLILRAYESQGAPCTAHISLSAPLSANGIHRANLLEQAEEDLPVSENHFEAPVGKYAIETYKLIRD